MASWKLTSVVSRWLWATLLAASVASAQAANPQSTPTQEVASPRKAARDPKIDDWKPATFPADALAFGAALEENAPPQLKKWCENYARTEMPKRKIDPRATMAVVDKEFSRTSDEARDAAIFLVFYLAYKEEDTGQRQLAARIRRLDDEVYDIARNMQLLKEAEQKQTASPRGVPSQQVLLRNEEQARDMEQELRTLSEERRAKMSQMQTQRKRVDAYLRVMGISHGRMQGIEPSVLRTMQ